MRDNKKELFEAEYSTSTRRSRKSGEGPYRDGSEGIPTRADLKPTEVFPHQAREQMKRNIRSQDVGHAGVPAYKAIRKSIERNRRKRLRVESVYDSYCRLGVIISEITS